MTVRYEKGALFAPSQGVVRPTARRVLGHMQAASVLSTSKAATRGADEASSRSEAELAALRKYAALLGEDEEAQDALAESEQVLQAMAAPQAADAKSKAMTAAAVRRHRGSKDFGQA